MKQPNQFFFCTCADSKNVQNLIVSILTPNNYEIKVCRKKSADIILRIITKSLISVLIFTIEFFGPIRIGNVIIFNFKTQSNVRFQYVLQNCRTMVSLNVTFYLFFYKKKKPIIICRFFKNLQKKQKHAEPKKLQCRYFNYLQKNPPIPL